jgi:hypothetical protein
MRKYDGVDNNAHTGDMLYASLTSNATILVKLTFPISFRVASTAPFSQLDRAMLRISSVLLLEELSGLLLIDAGLLHDSPIDTIIAT